MSISAIKAMFWWQVIIATSAAVVFYIYYHSLDAATTSNYFSATISTQTGMLNSHLDSFRGYVMGHLHGAANARNQVYTGLTTPTNLNSGR